MSMERRTFATREEWLAGRQIGIGASEAAAACGLSPWMTPIELWRLKTGRKEAIDLSENAAVQQGVRMEPAIREFFKAMHPEFCVAYNQFDILFQTERPWMFATLDGEITDADGRRGILEIKTATPSGKAGWSKWSDGKLPQNYFAQTLHQLWATGYDFVYLFAALYSMNGDITLREYEIWRDDVKDDLTWLLDKETEFWRHVTDGTIPAMPLMM